MRFLCIEAWSSRRYFNWHMPYRWRTEHCLFYSIDLVSSYPAGKQYVNKGFAQACIFILHTCRELGFGSISRWTVKVVLGTVVNIQAWSEKLCVVCEDRASFFRVLSPWKQCFCRTLSLGLISFCLGEKAFGEPLWPHSASFFSYYRTIYHNLALAGRSPWKSIMFCRSAKHHSVFPAKSIANHWWTDPFFASYRWKTQCTYPE